MSDSSTYHQWELLCFTRRPPHSLKTLTINLEGGDELCSFFFYFLVFFNCYHFSVDLHFSAQPLEKAETAGIMTDTEIMKTQCKSMQEIYKYI